MKEMKCLIVVLMLFACSAGSAGEAAAAADKKEVESLMRGIFARTIDNLESPTAKNGEAVCAFYKSVFDPTLIALQGRFCGLKPPLEPRYLALQDRLNDLDDGRVPKFRLAGSSVSGNRAVVKVNAPTDKDLPNGRVVYFLKKTDQGWRITNMLAYKQWPVEFQTEGDTCATMPGSGFSFALPPTGPEMFEDLPAKCRRSYIDTYSRIGWGK